MTSEIYMSLEDIIKKKKTNKQKSKQPVNQFKNKLKPQQSTANLQLVGTDARNKIITKKRTQIVDAREKLAELAKQKDARLKLDLLRTKKIAMNQVLRKKMPLKLMQEHIDPWPRSLRNKQRVFLDPTRQVSSGPHKEMQIRTNRKKVLIKGFIDNRTVASKSFDYGNRIKPITRTVDNDVIMIDADEDVYVPKKPNLTNRKASLNFTITAHNPAAREKNQIKRNMEHEKEQSPPRPPSILKKRPIAAMRLNKDEKTEPFTASEFRIIVSNLRNSVTASDIEELFGDIGGLKESRLVRPGTAEVIYKKLEDAQKAVDLYHNRQLDGQPMNCLLVNPRSAKMTSSSRSPGLPPSSSSNVEPDISTFHKVLFSNF